MDARTQEIIAAIVREPWKTQQQISAKLRRSESYAASTLCKTYHKTFEQIRREETKRLYDAHKRLETMLGAKICKNCDTHLCGTEKDMCSPCRKSIERKKHVVMKGKVFAKDPLYAQSLIPIKRINWRDL